MTEERFEQLLRTAGRDYNRPPDVPPLEEMWTSIEQANRHEAPGEDAGGNRRKAARRSPLASSWLRSAAALLLGLALGRASTQVMPSATQTAPTALLQTSQAETLGQYPAVTDQYLVQTAGLLLSLPGELRDDRADATFVARADDLLLQTRLLLDSPAAGDPGLHTLFEDLEFVLAQVVRLQAQQDPTRVDLLNEALEQRDLIPRLRSAVVNHISD